jgi:hypothetical protein
MKMNDLLKMEKIVDSNPELSWDGWDIIHLKEDINGIYEKNGMFKDGKWFVKNVYKLENDGWKIPKIFIGESIV